MKAPAFIAPARLRSKVKLRALRHCGLDGFAERRAGSEGLEESRAAGGEAMHIDELVRAHHERVLRSPFLDRAELGLARIHGPNGHHRMGRAQDRRGGMRLQDEIAQLFRRDTGDVLRRERRRIPRMVGARPQIFQADDVGQIGELARRLEAFDEFGKAFAVVEQHGRARRMAQHELPRHGAEKFFSDDFFRRRVACRQGAGKAKQDVVAVDREATGRRARWWRS